MRIRVLVYAKLPVAVLSKRVDKISKELQEECNVEKRMKLIDEDFDILMALIRKNRNNAEFINFARECTAEFISKNG